MNPNTEISDYLEDFSELEVDGGQAAKEAVTETSEPLVVAA